MPQDGLATKVFNEISTTMNKRAEVGGHDVPKNWIGFVVFLLIMGVMASVFSGAADQEIGGGSGGDIFAPKGYVRTDYTNEGMTEDLTITIPDENVIWVNFTLTWRDEADEPNRQNEPDSFTLGVTTPWGEDDSGSGTNPRNGEGTITLDFTNYASEDTPYNSEGTGDYEITVRCDDAGNQVFIGGIFADDDDGNQWTLTMEYIYRVKGGNSFRSFTRSDRANENSNTPLTLSIKDENIKYVNFTLVWWDEEDEPGAENEPDNFAINVTTSWNESNEVAGANPRNGEGRISLTFVNPSDKKENEIGTGDYEVVIRCGDCGEQWESSTGLIGENDSGNDWTLIVEYVFDVSSMDPETIPPPAGGGTN